MVRSGGFAEAESDHDPPRLYEDARADGTFLFALEHGHALAGAGGLLTLGGRARPPSGCVQRASDTHP
jgi:hypothetical protein